MASPPTKAYSTTTTSSSSSSFSSCSFSSKKSQISIKKYSNRPPSKVSCKAINGDQNPRTKVSCKAINGDQNPSTKVSCKAINGDQNPSTEISIGKFDRRNVLVGLGGVYGASTLGSLASADPVSAPDDFPEGAAPGAKNASKKKSKAGVANAAETSSVRDVFPTSLNRVVRVTVPRPKKSRSKKEKEEEEEILVIQGIELEKDVFVKFDVYINDEDDKGPIRPDRSEFAGSFVNVPHKTNSQKKKTTKTCLRIGISELLEDVGAEDDDDVVVTLVPKNGNDLVTIGGINIELDS